MESSCNSYTVRENYPFTCKHQTVTSRFARTGYWQTIHHESNNPTFCNDSSAAALIDNDFPAGEDNWDLKRTSGRKKVKLK